MPCGGLVTDRCLEIDASINDHGVVALIRNDATHVPCQVVTSAPMGRSWPRARPAVGPVVRLQSSRTLRGHTSGGGLAWRSMSMAWRFSQPRIKPPFIRANAGPGPSSLFRFRKLRGTASHATSTCLGWPGERRDMRLVRRDRTKGRWCGRAEHKDRNVQFHVACFPDGSGEPNPRASAERARISCLGGEA